MAVDVLSGVASGLISNHFFNKEVDTGVKAFEKITKVLQEQGQVMIGSASSEMKLRQIEIFNGLQTFMDNFRNTFSDEMEKTVEKTSKAAQERISQIDSMVYRWFSGSNMQQELGEFKALAAAFITTMREKTVSKALPNKSVLGETYPKCVAPVKGITHIAIRCIGFFPEAANPQLPPILVLKGKAFSHVSNGSHIEFSVPSSLLFSEDQNSSVISFSVKIPYEIKGWLFNTILYSEYKRLLSLLPEFPGKISLEYVTVSIEEKEGKDVVATFWQDSKKVKHGGEYHDIINRPHVFSAPVGWRVVPGSHFMHVHCNEGKGNSWSGVTEGPTQVHFTASTYKHDKEEKCGKLGINLGVRFACYHEVAKTTLEDLGLTWGESRVLDTSKWRSWRVIFQPFDGPERVYNGNVDGKYLSIESPSGQPVVSIKHYSEVTRSSAVPEPILARL